MRRYLLIVVIVMVAVCGLGDWKWVSGPLVPGSHTHGQFLARTYHLWVRDGWSGAVYTCSVPRHTYDRARYYGYADCLGRYGKG